MAAVSNPNFSSPAPDTVCDNCLLRDQFYLYRVPTPHSFACLCPSCVLRLHPKKFCATCFGVYESSVPENAIICSNCYSSSHFQCVRPKDPDPYDCAVCTDPESWIFKLEKLSDSDAGNLENGKCWVINEKGVKIFLTAAKIVANVVRKAADAAWAEAERKAALAAHSEKKAKKALEHLVNLTERERHDLASTAAEGSGSRRGHGARRVRRRAHDGGPDGGDLSDCAGLGGSSGRVANKRGRDTRDVSHRSRGRGAGGSGAAAHINTNPTMAMDVDENEGLQLCTGHVARGVSHRSHGRGAGDGGPGGSGATACMITNPTMAMEVDENEGLQLCTSGGVGGVTHRSRGRGRGAGGGRPGGISAAARMNSNLTMAMDVDENEGLQLCTGRGARGVSRRSRGRGAGGRGRGRGGSGAAARMNRNPTMAMDVDENEGLQLRTGLMDTETRLDNRSVNLSISNSCGMEIVPFNP